EPATACYETATFNTTSCMWEVTGSQPAEPATACYETATFNTTSCMWEVTDNGTGNTYYNDNDGDGFGNPNISIVDCTAPTGYVIDNTDCDDTDLTIYPGAPEVANDGIDQDCDGSDLTTLDLDKLNINNILVTPNPFNNNITINLPLGFDNNEFSIKVFDLNGRLIIDRKYTSMNSKINVDDLDKLDQAPYLFKIVDIKTGLTSYKRLIKY
uniref:putative metal-binding motif-containing protein n=1 Tax=uncultured Algibacter sp. TaxID=298659 RepID=UPI0026258D01